MQIHLAAQIDRPLDPHKGIQPVLNMGGKILSGARAPRLPDDAAQKAHHAAEAVAQLGGGALPIEKAPQTRIVGLEIRDVRGLVFERHGCSRGTMSAAGRIIAARPPSRSR